MVDDAFSNFCHCTSFIGNLLKSPTCLYLFFLLVIDSFFRGKMGASSHRSVKEQAIGCKPPFLMPYFGMYGYGGLIASMHLGRRGLVSSKTKQSKKVSILQLDREALLKAPAEQSWRADGGFRHPLKSETEKASHGSFTKVEIFEPSYQIMDMYRLQCALKDIYFPYIQNNEVSKTGRTTMPIQFVVNGANLAEVTGGEVAVTNLLSCNGPEFTLQLHFSQDVSTPNLGLKASVDANARLKCVYFPIIRGKESIDGILERLKENGCGISEDFKSFSHVSIRRLGRLLPDARWAWLPFMEPKQRKGVRGLMLKRCCCRVKCFIDTDAGFSPTTSKTDVAHHHPYTIALKNFGSKTLDKDVHIKIMKDGKELNLTQLDKQYIDWISQMHDAYDEEVDSGEDEPIFIVGPSNKNELGISNDVIRVHKRFCRKGYSWKSGQKVKVLKGACAGYHRTNTYATLEYIILENLKGDAGGEARLICRPMDVQNDSGCALHIGDENASIDIGKSISLPVSVIDTGKFVAVEDAEWEHQIEKSRQKAPSSIDVLNSSHCLNLGIEGEVPAGVIDAGFVPPKEIVAVIRPACFKTVLASEPVNQKDILEEDFEMTAEIVYRDENKKSKTILSRRIRPSSRKGFHGLYILALRAELPELFQKAGHYTFLFSLEELSCLKFEKRVHVKALPQVGRWKLLSDPKINKFSTRVGSCFPPILVGCYDRYSNRIPFPRKTKVKIKISSGSAGFNAQLTSMEQSLSSDFLSLRVENVMVKSCTLDKIRPNYDAKFSLSSRDESFCIETQCQVFPGVPEKVSIKSLMPGKQLIPGQVIRDLKLEIYDKYNNHVREHEVISLEADGFCIQKRGSDFKVDGNGCLDLSGILKVTEGYGRSVSFSVLSKGRVIFEQELQTERRHLRAAFELPVSCAAGTPLENLIFEVINSEGEVDKNIHNEDKGGQLHTLTIQSDSLQIDDSVRYSFSYGRCKVRNIPVSVTEGIFYFEVAHSFHPELHLSIEVHVEQAPDVERECFRAESLDKRLFPLQGISGITPSEMESVDFHNQTSDERLGFPDLFLTSNVRSLLESIINDQKFLEDNLCRSGSCIKKHEDTIQFLEHEQYVTRNEICNLQASLDLDDSHDQECTSEKDWVVGQIAHKSGTAAALFCSMFQPLNNNLLDQKMGVMDKILGVVACLGIVRTNELSRILARFLGEDQMLAIVCECSSSASNLVKYGPDGQVNVACGLHALAANLGLTLDGQFVLICLENIRPYAGEISNDSRRILSLPNPTLSNGNPPPGFLGFAVNMIDPDVNHWNWRTSSGHGLRETLFYRLFGELQVYESREDMNKASYCITGGAVSLDGGIIINGIFPMGHCEPDIRFPVVCSHTGKHFSEQNVRIMRQIEEKRQKLRVVSNQLKTEQKNLSKVLKKYTKKRDRYQKFLKEKGPFLSLRNSASLSQQ